MIEPAPQFSALRPEFFAASRGVDTVFTALATLGERVGVEFALYLGELSGTAVSLKKPVADNRRLKPLDHLAIVGSVELAVGSEGAERLLVAVDQQALDGFIEQCFGGDALGGGSGPVRKASKIERSLAALILQALCHTIERALGGPDARKSNHLDLIEELDAADLGDLLGPVKLNFSEADGDGGFYFALPRSAVERFAAAQSASEVAAKAIPDSLWQARMQESVKSADITIDAVLDGPALLLADIIRLRSGQMIDLGAGLDGFLRIEHRGMPLYLARLGQTDGALSVRIECALSVAQTICES